MSSDKNKVTVTIDRSLMLAKEVMHFRVSEDEARAIDIEAARAGLSRSAFLRKLVVSTIIK